MPLFQLKPFIASKNSLNKSLELDLLSPNCAKKNFGSIPTL